MILNVDNIYSVILSIISIVEGEKYFIVNSSRDEILNTDGNYYNCYRILDFFFVDTKSENVLPRIYFKNLMLPTSTPLVVENVKFR